MIIQSFRKFAGLSIALAIVLSVSAPPSHAIFGWGEKKAGAAEVMAAAVSEVTGSVRTQSKGGAWTAATAQQALNAGDKIKTGSDGSTIIAFTDGSVIQVDKNSTFVFEGHSRKKVRVRLSIGYIKAWIKKSSRRYTVRTPTSVAAVRGTEFVTAVDASGRTTWDLFKGSLNITDNFGNSASLAAGNRLVATKTKGLQKAQSIPKGIKMAPKPKAKLPKQAKQPPPPPEDEPPPADDEPPPADEPPPLPPANRDIILAPPPEVSPSAPGSCIY